MFTSSIWITTGTRLNFSPISLLTKSKTHSTATSLSTELRANFSPSRSRRLAPFSPKKLDGECEGGDSEVKRDGDDENEDFDVDDYGNLDSARYQRLAEAVLAQQIKVFVKQFCAFSAKEFVLEKDFLEDFVPWFNAGNRRFQLAKSTFPLRMCDTFRTRLAGYVRARDVEKQFKGVRSHRSSRLGDCFLGLIWKENTERGKIFKQKRAEVAAFLNRLRDDPGAMLLPILADFVDKCLDGAPLRHRLPGSDCLTSLKGAESYNFFQNFCNYAEEQLRARYGYNSLVGDNEPSFYIENIYAASYEYDLDMVAVPYFELIEKLGTIQIVRPRGDIPFFRYVGAK